MFGPDEDGGYEEYEASPYNGDDLDGGAHDEAFDEEVDFEEDEEDGDDGIEDEGLDGPGGEDAFLDSEWEDRLSGITGFEPGE